MGCIPEGGIPENPKNFNSQNGVMIALQEVLAISCLASSFYGEDLERGGFPMDPKN